MARHFSSRYYYYLALVTTCLALALALRRVELLAIASPFVVVILTSLFSGKGPKLTVSHVVDNPNVFEGDGIHVHISISANAQAPIVEILQPLPPGFLAITGTNDNFISLEEQENRGLSYTLQASNRGRYILGNLIARIHSADGLAYWEEMIEQPTGCVVYPKPESIRQTLRPFHTQVYTGNYPSRVGGEGIEFFDTKILEPGQPSSRINWRVSARNRSLYVNEFVRERNADIVLLLDVYVDLGASPQRHTDFAARCAASMARHFLRGKNRVGYIELGFHFQWLLPATGTRQWFRILDSLADLQVRPRHVSFQVDHLPRRILPSRALILAITSGIDERFIDASIDLKQRGYDVVLIVVPANRLIERQMPDKADLRIALRIWKRIVQNRRRPAARAGLPVLSWDIDKPMELLIRSIEAERQRRIRSA